MMKGQINICMVFIGVHLIMLLLYSRKFSPGEKFRLFHPAKFLICVNDYIEPMAVFTTRGKIYSAKYFCNANL